jgi:hypothetical protein
LELTIKGSKTKFMTLLRKRGRTEMNVKSGQYTFEIVEKFTYLGMVLSANNDI